MATEVSIGVVGTGGIGRHHARILGELAGPRMAGVYDLRAETAAAVAHEQGLRVHASFESLVAESDAVVLATPTSTHAELGVAVLERGRHLLVEKPLAADLAEADRLIAAATAADCVLAVGHVEFFNPAVQTLLAQGARPGFVEVQRLGVFSPRSLDVDVILDLMIHDLQILQAWDGSELAEIRATGIPVLSDRIDIANVRLAFASGCVANLTASRVSAERVRKLRAFLPRRYYSLDFQTQEIRGAELAVVGEGPGIRGADLPVTYVEPLRAELQAFLAACAGEPGPRVDGAAGRQALATALAIRDQIRSAW